MGRVLIAAASALGRKLASHRLDMLIAGAAIVVLAAPLAARTSEPLDFINHLWLVWAAGKALFAAGHPTYFINTTTQGVFNPWFAFYGGTVYEATGAISEVIGHPYIAYAGTVVVAIAAAYVGTLVCARQCGLRGLIAHAPALAVVTSAYFVTNIYGRGAWPEFMALAAIPPLIASAVHLLRVPTWRVLPMLAFVASVVILTGSHNITLLWSVTVGLIVALAMRLALGRPRRLPHRRRVAMIVGLGVTAALVNAWFLLTDVLDAGHTFAGTYKTLVVGNVAAWDAAGVLFDPGRTAPVIPQFPYIYVQLPDWVLAWGLATGAFLLWRRRADRRLRRIWLAAVTVTALLLATILYTPLWAHMPYPFVEIQFPFRINGYLVYLVAGIVLVTALALQRADGVEPSRRVLDRLRLALVAVVAVSLALCVWQEFAPSTSGPGYVTRGAAFTSSNVLPPSWYDAGSYIDHGAPVVAVPAGRALTIAPTEIHGDRFSGWVDVPPGPQPIQTNIAGGDYVVSISGLRWLGRDAAGYAVVARLRNGSGPVHVVIDTAQTAATVIGEIVSLAAIAALLAILTLAGLRTRRVARSRRATGRGPATPNRDL